MILRRLRIAALAATGLLAATAPAALAATGSSNWAGYAIHRDGLHFSQVVGSWKQPDATCTPGHKTYSAFWVGIGGFSVRSQALEQIGTEVDCTASGQVRSTAWYELVPADSRAVHIAVKPGDTVAAAVRISGRRVTLMLTDTTTGASFSRTVKPRQIDTTSAEWIAEAPSACGSVSASCRTLPLADFGSTTFTAASARTAHGFQGTISSPRWTASRIVLLASRSPFSVQHGAGAAGTAVPSTLQAGGSVFAVNYTSSGGK